LTVLIAEARSSAGGGLRSAELTLPGFTHDVCSAVHPMAAASPFFLSIPLSEYGLEFVFPGLAMAHPFANGKVAILSQSIPETALSLGEDGKSYERMMNMVMQDWSRIFPEILSPLHFPKYPLAVARFGTKAILPATRLIHKYFRGPQASGFFAGMAAHSMRSLSTAASSAFGLVLAGIAHSTGWPVAKGGSGRIVEALSAYFISLGGKIELNFPVTSLGQLPSSHAIMLDTSPHQLLQIAGQRLSYIYQWQLKRYRYGMGVYKMDWAIEGSIPFTAPECRLAGTLHLGNSFGEIEDSESAAARGSLSDSPFVLLAQQSLFDPSRSPDGKHTVWGYCHTPLGSVADRSADIEKQVERFAPGFRDRILARHIMNPADMEAYNPNCLGGAIDGGEESLSQLFTRPALRFSPYRTSAKGIYLCSSSTPPGGGAHGMCGYHAALRVLRDIFNLKPT